MKGVPKMRSELRQFFAALASFTVGRVTKPALWATVASMLLLAAAQPSAYGLDFPMTSRLALPDSANLTSQSPMAKNLRVKSGLPMASLSTQMSEMAIVANLSRQVEMARTIVGAKNVTKAIMADEYGWENAQYRCLNNLWTKESHWNYKAHNYRSGAHGIPQALPASKMDLIADDWRTNPVTQIRWGLRYIEDRYETPCGAWSKFKRHRYY
jgi:hypothetical protein